MIEVLFYSPSCSVASILPKESLCSQLKKRLQCWQSHIGNKSILKGKRRFNPTSSFLGRIGQNFDLNWSAGWCASIAIDNAGLGVARENRSLIVVFTIYSCLSERCCSDIIQIVNLNAAKYIGEKELSFTSVLVGLRIKCY